jgi:hypothetical protein
MMFVEWQCPVCLEIDPSLDFFLFPLFLFSRDAIKTPVLVFILHPFRLGFFDRSTQARCSGSSSFRRNQNDNDRHDRSTDDPTDRFTLSSSLF